MNLNQMFTDAPALYIENLMVDSRRKVKRGLFFCLKGMYHDGHQFVDMAIKNGAVAVVHSDPLANMSPTVTYIKVDDVLKTLNGVAHRFYGTPSSQMLVYGVTGTNGKSTTATLLKYFNEAMMPTGYIGTIAIEYGSIKDLPLLTTPDVIDLHATFAKMVKAGMKAVALEVSSHGLEQQRVASVDFDVAIFTNLTHDHLDFHGNMENYYQAKKKLFTMLKPSALSIINVDDKYGHRLSDEIDGQVIRVGTDLDCDYQASDIQLFPKKTVFNLHVKHTNETVRIVTNVVAMFNVSNLLGVIAAVHQKGLPLETIVEMAKSIPQVDGRMEIIDMNQGFNVIVDYAHTPDGLTQIFKYATSITNPSKRIIAVFGSAGQRDTKKRPIFGELADKYCDMIILTEEDPRTEKVRDICNEIRSGIKGTNAVIIEDRYDAIHQACSIACTGDTVLILGKGDEPYMYREFGREDWMGDHEAAKDILQSLQEEQKENLYE